jgi:hypothetical protein
MPFDEKSLETTVRLLAAHQQRYAELHQIGARLLDPAFYRSRDGKLVVGQLPAADLDQLVAKMAELLDEANVIEANIRQAIKPAAAAESVPD